MTTCDGVNVSLSGQNLFPMYLDEIKELSGSSSF